ncbi:helix-turn-helix transcriptional regulator [Shewanella frigidimarina]|jgi:DNA-binding XRE family transcriptional regulator|uniref:helix-turn-helix transcriptional regulator n=1 Tax=Shewanella frigidimarina TaxID=56812 RepID=UPI003D7AE786
MKTPLRMCRKHDLISQDQLAREVDSSRATISRLERGEDHDVSGRVCLNLVNRYKKYGLTLEHLIKPESHPDFYID